MTIGILIGAFAMALIFIGLTTLINWSVRKRDTMDLREFQERTLAALERRNEIGEEIADAIKKAAHEIRR